MTRWITFAVTNQEWVWTSVPCDPDECIASAVERALSTLLGERHVRANGLVHTLSEQRLGRLELYSLTVLELLQRFPQTNAEIAFTIDVE